MREKRQTMRILATALVISLILGIGLEAGYLQSGVCEEAVKECLNDWYNQAWGVFGTIYCAMGYAFCKKYIDP